MNIVECQNVRKAYGNKEALKDISFHIRENTITGLIGRNGAGKTTLLKVIAGYYHETSGDIKVFSSRPFNNLQVSTNMILIHEDMMLPSSLNLEELLRTGEHFYPNWNMELAFRLMNYFSLDPKQKHANLSKGMKSTFNMILGLCARCPLTIFDEPTTGMDAAVRKDFYRALLKDYLSFPRTIIVSSHLLNEIQELLEHVLLLKDGEVKLHLPVEELKSYALGVRGEASLVQEWIKDKDVLYETGIGIGYTYAVVRNTFVEEQRVQGLEFGSVEPTDVCVYLTNTSTGGIDDVL